MSPKLQGARNQQGPPGNRMKKLARRNRAVATVMSNLHILQIIDDHQAMWFSADSDAEKRRIELRLRRQIALALVNFVGFEIAVHGVVTATIGDPLSGGSLLLIGIAILHAIGRGH